MPTETIYTNWPDGDVKYHEVTGENLSWTDVHDLAVGNSISDMSHISNLNVLEYESLYHVTRAFFYFELADFNPPNFLQLDSAQLLLMKVGAHVENEIGGVVLSAQKGTQDVYLDYSDYSSFVGVSFGTVDFTDGVLDSGDFGIITFNPTGVAYIESCRGIETAKICVREYNHDYLNVAPNTGGWVLAYISFAEQQYSSPSKLVLEYTCYKVVDLSTEIATLAYSIEKQQNLKTEITVCHHLDTLNIEISIKYEEFELAICQLKTSPRRVSTLLEEIYYIGESAPYSIQLSEKPSADYPVIIEGYIQVTSIPSAYNQFYLDSLAGICYFYLTQAGEKVVVSYKGIGSVIQAEDLNRFSIALKTLKNSIRGFCAVSMPIPDRRIRLFGGFISELSVLSVNEMFVDFGPKGNFEASRMPPDYWRKVLIGINATSEIAVEEGIAVSTDFTAVVPPVSTIVFPCTIVTLYDNGEGLTASITNIEQSQIKDVRSFIGGA